MTKRMLVDATHPEETRVAIVDERRLEDFDFDMTIERFSMSATPGDAMRPFFSSQAAATKGSYNLAGIADPVVDALIELIIGANNRADLTTIAYKHSFGGGLSAYVNWARIFNGAFAHYALGAGGRAVTIDCHDASDASGGLSSNPHCWAGSKPQGISAGMRYQF